MQKLLVTFSLAFTLATSAYAAEFDMRPGLWEIATTSDLLLFVPHIPSAQMKNIQDLAHEYGFDMPQIENGAAISKVCITPEMASQQVLPNFYQTQAGCASKKATRNGNSYQVEFSCDGADLKGNGVAEGRLTSAETFTGQSKFTGTVQGSPVNEKADISGKWLNANCAEVKPM